MKKNKRKFKLKIPHIHLIADTLILVLGIFLGAFLYAQLAPKATVNKPSITVQGVSTSGELAFMPPPPAQGSTCGNDVCEAGENYENCPADCHCGNGECESQSYGENSTNCPEDCRTTYKTGGCSKDSDCVNTGDICMYPGTTNASCIPRLDLKVDLKIYTIYPNYPAFDLMNKIKTATIKGQQRFDFKITPLHQDTIDKDIFENYINPEKSTVALVETDPSGNITKVSEMHCMKNLSNYEQGFQKETTWDVSNITNRFQTLTAYCDTLAFSDLNNQKIMLLPKSPSGETDVTLVQADTRYSAGIPGEAVHVIFYPFIVRNSYRVTSPLQNTTVSGSIKLFAELTGDAKSLQFTITGGDNQEATRVSGTEDGSNWIKSYWDTKTVSNGNHDINISFITLGGVQRDNVATPVAVTTNNTVTCLPDWSCPDWSTIPCPPNGGAKTRTCTDTNNCTTPNTKEETNDVCPIESCTDSCPDDTVWGPCDANKEQRRECSNNCGGTITEKIPCNKISGQTCLTTCPTTISWSACSKEGKQTRSCDDGCGNKITQTTDCLVQPSITYPTANLEISVPQPEIKGTAQGGSLVRLYWSGANGKIAQSPDLILVPSTNTFSYVLPWPLTDGTYKIYMEAFTSTGTTSVKSEAVSFKILAPEVVMLSPQANQQLTGSVTLTAEVKKGEIYTLDFYRDKVGGYTDYLISKATVQANNKNVWQYIWDTSATDNGEYDIYAKIKDAAKVKIYSSNKIRVKINNNIPSLPEPSKPSAEETKPTTDTDNDGLPDILEKKLGSDPNNADSNGDGISDSVSVEQGKSPIGDLAIKPELIKEVQEQIAEFKADEPKYGGVLNKDLQVSSIVSVAVEVGREGILIQGKGPPNTILTIYIYSRPIVVTTKTDENGNFSYVLEKDIAEGEHEVYVTVTDETGKVKEKSEPFGFFVKKARAVTRDEYFRGDVNVEQKTPPVLKTYIILCLAIVLAVLVGFVVYRVIKGQEKPSQRIRLKEDTSIRSK